MGGFGSGQSSNARGTVEGCRSIDVRYLAKEGLLRPSSSATLSWTNEHGEQTGSIEVRAIDDAIVLVYRYRVDGEEWQDVTDRVRVAWTPCNYGGRRAWFVCRCRRRSAKLYSAGLYFRCRHCYGLAYTSKRRGFADRQRWKAQNIRLRLGGSASLVEPFPPKPESTEGHRWTA